MSEASVNHSTSSVSEPSSKTSLARVKGRSSCSAADKRVLSIQYQTNPPQQIAAPSNSIHPLSGGKQGRCNGINDEELHHEDKVFKLAKITVDVSSPSRAAAASTNFQESPQKTRPMYDSYPLQNSKRNNRLRTHSESATHTEGSFSNGNVTFYPLEQTAATVADAAVRASNPWGDIKEDTWLRDVTKQRSITDAQEYSNESPSQLEFPSLRARQQGRTQRNRHRSNTGDRLQLQIAMPFTPFLGMIPQAAAATVTTTSEQQKQTATVLSRHGNQNGGGGGEGYVISVTNKRKQSTNNCIEGVDSLNSGTKHSSVKTREYTVLPAALSLGMMSSKNSGDHSLYTRVISSTPTSFLDLMRHAKKGSRQHPRNFNSNRLPESLAEYSGGCGGGASGGPGNFQSIALTTFSNNRFQASFTEIAAARKSSSSSSSSSSSATTQTATTGQRNSKGRSPVVQRPTPIQNGLKDSFADMLHDSNQLSPQIIIKPKNTFQKLKLIDSLDTSQMRGLRQLQPSLMRQPLNQVLDQQQLSPSNLLRDQTEKPIVHSTLDRSTQSPFTAAVHEIKQLQQTFSAPAQQLSNSKNQLPDKQLSLNESFAKPTSVRGGAGKNISTENNNQQLSSQDDGQGSLEETGRFGRVLEDEVIVPSVFPLSQIFQQFNISRSISDHCAGSGATQQLQAVPPPLRKFSLGLKQTKNLGSIELPICVTSSQRQHPRTAALSQKGKTQQTICQSQFQHQQSLFRSLETNDKLSQQQNSQGVAQGTLLSNYNFPSTNEVTSSSPIGGRIQLGRPRSMCSSETASPHQQQLLQPVVRCMASAYPAKKVSSAAASLRKYDFYQDKNMEEELLLLHNEQQQRTIPKNQLFLPETDDELMQCHPRTRSSSHRFPRDVFTPNVQKAKRLNSQNSTSRRTPSRSSNDYFS